MSCLCTRLIMYCPGGELDFWISEEAPEGYEEMFWNYLRALGVQIPNDKLPSSEKSFSLEFP